MKAQKVFKTLRECLIQLMWDHGIVIEGQNCGEGSLASALHNFYNEVGRREGWLKPEYATPLSQQDKATQIKNINAADGVLTYWLIQFNHRKKGLVSEMEKIVDYEANRGNKDLEAAAEAQHQRWRESIAQYQQERIIPGNAKFREDNYRQFLSAYADLSEKEKDQDRLIVAVVTDRVLERAGIDYKSKIKA